VAGDDVLNVRARPGVVHPIVGTLPPHSNEIQLAGAGERVDGALWVPIRHKETTGWVNSSYLARYVGSVSDAIAAPAAECVIALKHRDSMTLSRLVHPGKGVRFSPYAYVRTEPGPPGAQDLVFSASQLGALFAGPTVYHWGWFDGSGLPIELTFEAYLKRFIYDVDFARPHVVGYGEIIGHGNTINNVATVYSNAVFVEYHFEGFDPQFKGFDWKSLRLVFEEEGGIWYLVGVIHDEWTI